jgi:hypothetical protein
MKELTERFYHLKTFGDVSEYLRGVSDSMMRHFAAEATALDAAEMKYFAPSKRRTLLFCLIRQAQTKAVDDLITMFCPIAPQTPSSMLCSCHRMSSILTRSLP